MLIIINTDKGFCLELIEIVKGKSLINMKWESSITLFWLVKSESHKYVAKKKVEYFLKGFLKNGLDKILSEDEYENVKLNNRFGYDIYSLRRAIKHEKLKNPSDKDN